MADITIRAIELRDWEALYALQQCPKVRLGTLKMPYRSAADTKRRLEKALESESLYRLVAIETATGRLVGVITLSQLISSRQHVGQIGMAVHDDYHRQGIGSRLLSEVIDIADRWLALKRLELTVFTDNAPALKLYEKFGFVIEGTLKKYAFRAGNYLDAYTMARLL
jgi:L-phenylalanine/L-methionine N-acetyltransferase